MTTNPADSLPGIPCPDCGARLVISMQQLLGTGSMACSCGLVLHVDAERSRETLQDLRKLQQKLATLPPAP
jgi:hypothetical protein